MKRSATNLRLYKKTCKAVWERSSGVCEIIVQGKRCTKYIPFEESRAINYAHKKSRNGESDEWVLDPANLWLSCAEHHLADPIGTKTEGVEYADGEPIYVPDPL